MRRSLLLMPGPTVTNEIAHRRAYALLVWVAGLAIAWTLFPLFHVRYSRAGNDTEIESREAVAVFDAQRFAKAFWTNKLLALSDHATDVGLLTAALTRDPAAAAQQYGRRTGLGGRYFYFIRGEGRVRAVDRRGVWLSIAGQSGTPVLLMVGPVFGNALRDATGFADITGFNSIDFDSFGAELNRLAENEVQPKLQKARFGTRVRIVGCAEAIDIDGGMRLQVVTASVDYFP